MQTEKDVEFRWGIRIPMRDGIHLSATLYLPKDRDAPLPCVVILTPYTADSYHDRGMYFAARGLPFVVVDVRGRGNSDGTFHPYIQEAEDGHDVVEWLAGQPYCNGKVAMWGGSYGGYAQWATAKEFPPHLCTIVPAAAPFLGVDFPMRCNIFNPYLMQWLTFTSGRALQARIFADAAFWSRIFRQWHESGRPFRELDALLGNPCSTFQEWLRHPEPDAYWDRYNPTAQEYSRLQLPILTITGSYDDDQAGALEHYKRHMSNASEQARSRHYLVIGPWDHAGTRYPKETFGGLTFGPASLVNLPQLHLDWYAWTLLSGTKPAFLKKTVAYYVMGAEHWQYADSLEEITAHYETWFLDSAGVANDVFSSGLLGPAPGTGGPDTYTFDPRDMKGLEVDAEARSDAFSLVEQGPTLALCGKQLVYHTAPFLQAVEVSGFFTLTAWLAIDCPDTDFYVSIHEITLDGQIIRLSTDAKRARYREDPRASALVQTTAPLQYDFNSFTFVSRLVKRGHRLRLVISPMGRLIETTFTERNFNGGGVVAEESVSNARTVTVRLFHDDVHPSALRVPVGRAVGADR